MTSSLLRKIFFLFGAMLLSYFCQGQSYFWNGGIINSRTPLSALPMLYNSSFAGQAGTPRVSTSFSYIRQNYKFIPFEYYSRSVSAFTSFDQFIPAIASGIGITAGTYYMDGPNKVPDQQSIGAVNYHMASIAVAPKISIKGRYTLSPSLDFTYNQARGNENNFLYLPENEVFFQSRASLLFNSDKFYVGYSVHLLNQSPYKDQGSNLVYLSYLQLGYTFQKRHESNFSFTPQVAFTMHKMSDGYTPHIREVMLSSLSAFHLNFRYKQLIWGTNNTGYHLGWQNPKVRIMLSGYTNIKRELVQTYSANLSFRYIFNYNPGHSITY